MSDLKRYEVETYSSDLGAGYTLDECSSGDLVKYEDVKSLQDQLAKYKKVAECASEFVDAADENSPNIGLHHCNLVHALFLCRDKSDEMR